MSRCFMFLRTINKLSVPIVLVRRRTAGYWQCYSTHLLARVVGYQKHSGPCLHKFTLLQCQNMSSKEHEPECEAGVNLNYEDICKLKEKGKIILVDVRDPYEIQEVGRLPDSINIPLKELKFALQVLSDKEFKLKYGIPKPGVESPLVFSCAGGARSHAALDEATQMGFKKARYYQGGFTDWKEKCKKNEPN